MPELLQNLTETSWSRGLVRPVTSSCCTKSAGTDVNHKHSINNVTVRAQLLQFSTTKTTQYTEPTCYRAGTLMAVT